MKEQPLVSVVLPCYNHEKYVGQAIESVLNQTYQNIELIVADNGSTDGSYEVICGYRDRIDRIIRLKENSILFCSERLIMEATGEYIAFMTSDDYWEPDKLELQIQVLCDHPNIAAVTAWTVYMDDDLQPFPVEECQGPFKTEIFKTENRSRYEWFRDLLYKGNCLAWPSAVFRTEIYKKIWYRWRGHRQLSDYYTWLCTVQEYDIHVVPKVLVKYRWHPSGANRNESSVSNAVWVRHLNEQMDMLYDTIENVEDNFFLEAFKSELCLPDATSHEEILCEKFFQLKKLSEVHSIAETSAMLFFCRHFMEMRNVIHEKYHFTYADYHDWAGEHGVGALFVRVYGMMELMKRKDSERLWRIREILLQGAQTEEEYCGITKILFEILDSDSQELIRDLTEYIDKALGMMNVLGKSSAEEAYQNKVLLTESIVKVVDLAWKNLEFLGIGLKEEDWRMFKEILGYAKNEIIDFDEALIPYVEYIKNKLLRIFG